MAPKKRAGANRAGTGRAAKSPNGGQGGPLQRHLRAMAVAVDTNMVVGKGKAEVSATVTP
jgi:hypothetical protein